MRMYYVSPVSVCRLVILSSQGMVSFPHILRIVGAGNKDLFQHQPVVDLVSTISTLQQKPKFVCLVHSAAVPVPGKELTIIFWSSNSCTLRTWLPDAVAQTNKCIQVR